VFVVQVVNGLFGLGDHEERSQQLARQLRLLSCVMSLVFKDRSLKTMVKEGY
jgi:hypothetical protein